MINNLALIKTILSDDFLNKVKDYRNTLNSVKKVTKHERGTPVASFEQNIEKVFALGIRRIFFKKKDKWSIERILKTKDHFIVIRRLSEFVSDLK